MSTTVEEVAESLAYSIVQGETAFYKPCYENVLKELQALLTSQKNEIREKVTVKLDGLMEKLADMEHERWSKWQEYMHSKCVEHENGKGQSICFPSESFRHWERQINTSYTELSEAEKESDREQVRPYLELIKADILALLVDNKEV